MMNDKDKKLDQLLDSNAAMPDGAESTKADAAEAPKKKKKSKKGKKFVQHGVAHIQATYNNTIVSLADLNGNVIGWGSAGAQGFRDQRKAHPMPLASSSATCWSGSAMWA